MPARSKPLPCAGLFGDIFSPTAQTPGQWQPVQTSNLENSDT
ncbi:hypothetical protein EVA_09925 [gut metagenome]|uniref:Uncharacterized protein n=1 Tax=gut metagenome TaxID=749906 RepID=J9GPQ8_9ZZZZ